MCVCVCVCVCVSVVHVCECAHACDMSVYLPVCLSMSVYHSICESVTECVWRGERGVGGGGGGGGGLYKYGRLKEQERESVSAHE